MKRRELVRCGLFAGLLLAYAGGAVLFLSNKWAPQPLSRPEVLGTSVVRFAHSGDGPDPNDIFAAVNSARSEAGIPPLIADSTLAAVAEMRAQDMTNNNYYAHKNPEGQYYYHLLSDTAFAQSYSCENLDLNFSAKPMTFVQDWLGSTAGHKECLLNQSVTRAGYAAAKMSLGEQKQSMYVVVAVHAAE